MGSLTPRGKGFLIATLNELSMRLPGFNSHVGRMPSNAKPLPNLSEDRRRGEGFEEEEKRRDKVNILQ